MRIILWIIGAVMAALLAAVFVVPSLIDWNEYREEIAQRATALAGREVRIAGDIRLGILPKPAVIVRDVRVANVAGGQAPEMIRLASLEARVGLLPLLKGEVVVETVRLVEPRIALEVLADGRNNWTFAQPAAAPAAGALAPAPEDGTGGSAFDVRLNDFVIVNGAVSYRGLGEASAETIEDINARIAARSLAGPFESEGSLRLRGVPLEFQISVARLADDRSIPLNALLRTPAGVTQASLDGAVIGFGANPRFKGRIKAESENLGGLLAATAGAAATPILAQKALIEGELSAHPAGAEIANLALKLGETTAAGEVKLAFGPELGIGLGLRVPHLNLDKLLALAPAAAPVSETKAAAPAKDQRGATLAVPPAARKPADAERSGLPPGIAANLKVAVDAVTYRGALLRNTVLAAEVGGGEITLSQFSTQGPGSSDVAAFGVIGFDRSGPRFEGEVEANVADLRRVLEWLEMPPPPVPSERLRKVAFKGAVKGTPAEVQIGDIELAVDSSRITGGVTVALRARPAFGADLAVDRISLDAYRTDTAPTGAAKPAADGAKPAVAAAANPFAGLTALKSFDANLRLRIDQLVVERTPIRGAVLDATLFDGALEVRELAVADAAGVSARLTGGIGGLGGIPTFKDLRLTASARSLERAFQLAGIQPPVPAQNLGAVELATKLDGPALEPAYDVRLQAAGGTVQANGKLGLLAAALSGIETRLSVEHPDLAQLLARLGVDYRPQGRVGPFALSTRLAWAGKAATLDDLKVGAGPTQLAGRVSADWSGTRPRVVANLSGGAVAIDPFLPARRTAALAPDLDGRSPIRPAAWGLPAPSAGRGVVAAAAPRWPTEPIDLSALEAADADITLRAGSLAYQGYTLGNADVQAVLKDGLLRIGRLTGDLHGGALAASGTLTARAPALALDVAIKGADVAQLLKAAEVGTQATGGLDADLKVTSRGASVRDLVAALGGTGAIALKRIDVKRGGEGSALAGALAALNAVNQLGGALGGRQGDGLADLTGTFRIDRGVARSEDLALVSAAGNGALKGSVDLANWRIDAVGEVKLAQNLLTALLAQKTNVPQTVPIEIKGALDAPTVKVGLTGAPGTGATGAPQTGIKPLDKALETPGVGSVLQQVLPGVLGAPPQPQPAPQQQQTAPRQAAPAPQQQQQPQRQVRPEDVLQQLLRGGR